jgi:nucleotide-binding universal stress UspA family protein
LVHALDDSALDFLTPDLREAAATERSKRLQEIGGEIAFPDVRVAHEVCEGAADEVLLGLAARSETKVLVLSASGRKNGTRSRLGSVAERVAQNAAAPTVIVRESTPFTKWARGEHALRVVAAVDFSLAGDAVLDWVGQLARAARCSIVAVHVNWPPEHRLRDGETLSAAGMRGRNPLQQRLENQLHAQLSGGGSPSEGRVRLQPGWEPVETLLVRVAEEEKADLLVVGIHGPQGLGRLRHGSVSRGVLENAPMNVACVPAGPRPRIEAKSPSLKRVLVTTDLSDHGNRAIPYAYSIAGAGGAVCILYVAPPSGLQMHENSWQGTGEAGRRADSAATSLHELIPTEAVEQGIPTEVKVIEDREAARTICAVADHFGADVICMARHGRSGLTRAVLGSVTQEVLSRSPRPILVVGPE